MPRSRRSPARTVAAVVGGSLVVATALAACRSDGRELRPAKPTQTQSVYTPTTTTLPTTSSIDASKVTPLVTTTAPSTIPFTLQLPWADQGIIDTRFTCFGDDVQPQIAWLGAPAGTVEVALVVTDPDAGDFVHWVIAGLDPNNPLVGENDVPVGAIEGQNGFSTPAAQVIGWSGPCPPAGTTHQYWFTLYALGQQIELPTGATAEELIAVIESASIDASEITGIFTAPSAGASPTTTSTTTSTSSSTTIKTTTSSTTSG